MPDRAGPALRPMGGLLLDDPVLGPGGLSGLHLDPGLRLTAIGDTGTWLTARLRLAGDRLVGLDAIRTGRLRDGAGRPLVRSDRDAECLARLSDGTWLIGFERRHRLQAHVDLDGPGLYLPPPPGLDRAPANGGLESLAALADDRCLGIAEQLEPEAAGDLRAAWLSDADPRAGRGWRSLAYRPERELSPTDAATLPDGDVLVLERRFSLLGGFAGRLARISAAALTADVISGQTLLELAHPWPEENWEGVAVTRHAERLLVALVADDNQNAWQRQGLLLFELLA